MKIQGEHRFEAPREQVWEALLDPEVLSRTVPGGQELEKVGDNQFRGKLKMKVGPVQGVFEGKVTLSDLEPPSGYKMTIEGRGPAGFVNGIGALALAEDGDATVMTYEVDSQVGGRIASVGQRLVENSAKVITRQALEALDVQVRARSAVAAQTTVPGATAGGGGTPKWDPEATMAAPPPGPIREPESVDTAPERPAKPEPPPAPSTGKAAAGFAGGLLDELLPGGWVPWALGLTALILALVAFKSCS